MATSDWQAASGAAGVEGVGPGSYLVSFVARANWRFSAGAIEVFGPAWPLGHAGCLVRLFTISLTGSEFGPSGLN